MVIDMEIEREGKVVHIYCEDEAKAIGIARGIAIAQRLMKTMAKEAAQALSNGD